MNSTPVTPWNRGPVTPGYGNSPSCATTVGWTPLFSLRRKPDVAKPGLEQPVTTKSIFSLDKMESLPSKCCPRKLHPEGVPNTVRKFRSRTDTSLVYGEPRGGRPFLRVICRELILHVSGSPQRKEFLDNRTKNIYSCQRSKDE